MRYISFVAALLLIGDPCRAQTFQYKLRGLSQVEIVIGDLNQHSKACGVTKAGIREAFMFPASAAALQIVTASNSRVDINILTLQTRNEGICFSHVSVKVGTTQSVELGFSGRSVVATVPLWEWDSVLFSHASRHSQLISAEVEQLAKTLITDWNFDNKPEAGGDDESSGTPESKKGQTSISTGTGFAVTEKGDLVTNEHVVKGCSYVTAAGLCGI
jgi:S1-C subfamily serine protease